MRCSSSSPTSTIHKLSDLRLTIIGPRHEESEALDGLAGSETENVSSRGGIDFDLVILSLQRSAATVSFIKRRRDAAASP